MAKIHSGHMHISGDHVHKLMKGKKPGDKVKMIVHGKVESMESRDGMGSIMGPEDKKKKKAAPEHHMSVALHDVEDYTDESSPQDESE